MTFREKVAALTLIANLLIYGAYFGDTTLEALDGVYALDQGRLIGTIAMLIVIVITGSVVLGIFSGREADAPADERDRLVAMRADQRAGYVVAFGAGAALVMAIAGLSVFWIANTVLAGLVAGEMVKSLSTLIDYRRGV